VEDAEPAAAGLAITGDVTIPTRIKASAGVALLVVLIAAGVALAAGRAARERANHVTPCADPYPAHRTPGNPLMLSDPSGGDPLRGASFFVDGPTHGAAAGEIARQLGVDSNIPIGAYLPAFPDDESWATFQSWVSRRLTAVKPGLAYRIRLLEKIADEPEAQRIFSGAMGGDTADFTRKLFCQNFTADPGTVPIITTYFLHAVLGGCPTTSQIDAYMPAFEQHVNAAVRWTGKRPVVYLLELDAVGSSSCMAHIGSLHAWETALRYEVDRFATLPHAVVYVEGGYSDANSPRYTARVLNAVDIRKIRGFFTNDTHMNWTINEIKWGDRVSKLTHGAHFVINTAQNGNGPLRNPHPSTEGTNDLCNPPRRGLGPRPNTDTGFPHVDAFLWTHVPGNSSGTCNGGPPSGDFWPARAAGLAARANGRLGPDYPSQPY
jgi:endoglucanase